MVKSTYSSIKSRLLSSISSRFIRDENGIAAIEFAFIAPIMLFMYFGMAEVATAISVDRKISHSANVAGDIATQYETISIDEMADIMHAATLVMNIPDDKLKYVSIEIASYSRTDDDDLSSVISRGKAAYTGGLGIEFPDFLEDAKKLDTAILSSSSGVMVARVNYKYEPLKLRYMPTEFDISEVFMLKPRKSANVEIVDSNSGSTNYRCLFNGTDGFSC